MTLAVAFESYYFHHVFYWHKKKKSRVRHSREEPQQRDREQYLLSWLPPCALRHGVLETAQIATALSAPKLALPVAQFPSSTPHPPMGHTVSTGESGPEPTGYLDTEPIVMGRQGNKALPVSVAPSWRGVSFLGLCLPCPGLGGLPAACHAPKASSPGGITSKEDNKSSVLMYYA